MARVIPLLTLESRLKRQLRRHLSALGFIRYENGWRHPQAGDKESVRLLHLDQRREKLRSERTFVERNAALLLQYFAEGRDVVPNDVRPVLVPVKAKSVESDLFRFASLLWSVPVSNGYGRRLRFLVVDASNGCLIGLFALGDPVFNLTARDNWVGWTAADRSARLANVLDCFVLGAVPPYRQLLGGKVIASMIRSSDVAEAFSAKYGNKPGLISNKNKQASLSLVTVTSALGRSSLYNRLILQGAKYFDEVGYTKGWGHFHISDDFFCELREYLRRRKHAYASANRFGDGPNWRLRVVREGIEALGFNPNLLRHGIARQVFCCEMATNTRSFLRGESTSLDWYPLKSASDVGLLACDRWLIPRASRDPQYLTQTRGIVLADILSLAGPDTFSSTSLLTKPIVQS